MFYQKYDAQILTLNENRLAKPKFSINSGLILFLEVAAVYSCFRNKFLMFALLHLQVIEITLVLQQLIDLKLCFLYFSKILFQTLFIHKITYLLFVLVSQFYMLSTDHLLLPVGFSHPSSTAVIPVSLLCAFQFFYTPSFRPPFSGFHDLQLH